MEIPSSFPPEEGLAPRPTFFLLDGENDLSVGIVNIVLLPLLTLSWVLPVVFKKAKGLSALLQ